MKKKMIILIAVIIVIIAVAVITLRPSNWRAEGETTEVTLTINGKSIPAEFNHTKAAQEVLNKMPFTVSFTSSGVDYCGSIGSINYDEKDMHRGWVTGDIIYMTNGNWFSIFTGMQNSIVPGNLTLGHISSGYIDEVMDWKNQGSITVTFEISEDNKLQESSTQKNGDKQDEEIMQEDTTETGKDSETNMTMYLTIGESKLTAELANNSSAEALVSLLEEGPLTIDMRDYGGMEKVGDIGTTLPSNNEQITTEAGDLILYMDSAFVIYYAPNSWNFTRLGKIQNLSADELKDILGDGAVCVTLSLE